MSEIHSILLYLHIALGAIALLLYWLPVVVRKGSKLHVNAGNVFYYLMLIVSGSGMVMSLMGLYDPVGIYTAGKQMTTEQIERMLVWRVPFSQFLLLLSLLTWVTVRHAIGVLQAKSDRAMLRRWNYQAPVLLLFPTALYVAWQGIIVGMPLLIIFAAVSLTTATTISLYVYKSDVKPRAWIIEHFSAMIGSGIAVYTAFFAAGGRRMLSQWLPGEWQLVSWLAAPVIGLTALILLTGCYKRKYKVQHNNALQQG
ncbi:hypothetical protein [Rheinheimera maricola]|uniref:DUF2306 domain-containing protein n=1 Tax=Rheinheimera maricola TaxID=2793282 RepID=A0ABS7XBU7_9GAMM|nr:hypothetical protein [Rheinheimera maricola]MBZ9612644.1 hypothetical protein [Rheinheimera maricola]